MGCRGGGGSEEVAVSRPPQRWINSPQVGSKRAGGWGGACRGGSSEGYVRAMTDLQPAVCGQASKQLQLWRRARLFWGFAFVYFGRVNKNQQQRGEFFTRRPFKASKGDPAWRFPPTSTSEQ